MQLRDPATAVLADPQVPESKRYCATCDQPVGRGRDGQPGRTEGFCPRDGTPYSFAPRLAPGEMVNNRYEVLGCLAHGGLGWIYLARDSHVSDAGSDRWVVLKGLINTGDADAMAAALAERRYLVAIDHPNIVKIYDFAQHPDPRTGLPVGYIVMEYVGGQSLRDIALQQRAADGSRVPLPLPQVIAYGLEVLPALGYLHDRDLLYCDFKPDNAIHAEEQLKLIDLGAVRHMDDNESALYGTPGYQAPELATAGPSVSSDLYTVGRALAVLSFDFGGFSTRYADRLPDPADVSLLRGEESYYRLLRRCTHPDPDRRFDSAAELSTELLGVLREVLSAGDGQPRPVLSTAFTPERRVFGAGGADGKGRHQRRLDPAEVAAALPLPLVDLADPGAGFLATVGGADPAATVAALKSAPVWTLEVLLRLIRAHIEVGDLGSAIIDLDALSEAEPLEWRCDWYRGLVSLAGGDPAGARAAFDAVYDVLPGEPATRLALAAATELDGDAEAAERRYLRVWQVDRGFVSAAFALARLRLARGGRMAAVGVLDEVPDTSSQYVAAQLSAVRALVDPDAGTIGESDLVDASARLERLRLDAHQQAEVAVELLSAALAWMPRAGVGPARTARVLGKPLSEREVRFGLERAYRMLATLEREAPARWELVDQANAVRPRTVV